MVTLILLAVLIALGWAAYTGRTADSRDPDYALGLVTKPQPRPDRAGASR